MPISLQNKLKYIPNVAKELPEQVDPTERYVTNDEVL
jgi:hypothetical protein